MDTWKNKILKWRNNYIQKYPKHLNKRFFYETSVCDKYMSTICREFFIESDELNSIQIQDYTPFIEQIKKSTNRYVTSFYNISGDTLLIIPMPQYNKNFITIKDFIDTASIEQQIEFWKFVSYELEKFLQINNQVYVSTHGLGVSYFHLRLCTKPKYYHTRFI